MGDLIKKDPLDFGFKWCVLGKTGGTLTKVPSVAEFSGAAKLVGRADGALNWWIGFLHNQAEELGEEYEGVLSQISPDYEHGRKCAWVEKNVPPSNRREDLSWSHHRVVAAMSPVEQEMWLAKAAPDPGDDQPRLTIASLKREIKADKATRGEDEPVEYDIDAANDLLFRKIESVFDIWPKDELQVFVDSLNHIASHVDGHTEMP